jgi:hypothetical protein
VHELSELGEVLADEGEVVLVVESTDPQDPLPSVPVADPAAERVSGVRRVGDQRIVTQGVGNLVESSRLRVFRVQLDVARHVRPWPPP